MIHDYMKISLVMVNSQKVEEESANRKSRDAKRAISFDGGSSKGT